MHAWSFKPDVDEIWVLNQFVRGPFTLSIPYFNLVFFLVYIFRRKICSTIKSESSIAKHVYLEQQGTNHNWHISSRTRIYSLPTDGSHSVNPKFPIYTILYQIIVHQRTSLGSTFDRNIMTYTILEQDFVCQIKPGGFDKTNTKTDKATGNSATLYL